MEEKQNSLTWNQNNSNNKVLGPSMNIDFHVQVIYNYHSWSLYLLLITLITAFHQKDIIKS